MCVDERRHNGLAPQIDARSTTGNLYVRLRPNLSEAIVLDDEHRVFDGLTTVAYDQSGAFEDRRVRSATRVRVATAAQGNESQQHHGRKRNCDARVTMA